MTIKFPEFNQRYNPDDEAVYVKLKNKKPAQSGALSPVTFAEIVAEAKVNPELEIGWLVPMGTMIIDIDKSDQAAEVLKIIQDRNEPVMVTKTSRGIHIYCKSDFNKKTTNNILACGVFADTIPHVSGNTFITTPFKMKGNTSPNLTFREVVYYNGIKECPFWLRPIYNSGKKDEDAIITVPLSANRNDCLNRHLWRLKTTNLVQKEREETIRIINKHICKPALSDEELDNTVLRAVNNTDIVQKEFFDGKNFLHHKMGDFLITTLHIKRNKEDKALYYYNEDDKIYSSNKDYLIGTMTKLCPSLKEFQKQEVLKYIEAALSLNMVAFNKDPYNIVFKNCIVNLATMTTSPLGPNHLETIQLNCNYNPSAKSTTAEDFFNTSSCSDKDIQRLLYEAIGYAMLKTNRLEKAFILTGSGRNGKSTFLDVLKELLGKENTTSVSMKDLKGNFRSSSLMGKLASLAGDISSQPIHDSDLIKSLITGEEVLMERKYQDAVQAEVFSTLFFSANKLPRSPDTSFGFYRRLCIIPFNANLDSVSRVGGITFRNLLLAKESIEYIAYNAVQAIYEVMNTTQDFTQPKVVVDMLDKYRIENSSVLTFIDEEYGYDPTKLVGIIIDQVYAKYSVFCDVNNYKPVASRRFTDEVLAEFESQGLDNVLNKFVINKP